MSGYRMQCNFHLLFLFFLQLSSMHLNPSNKVLLKLHYDASLEAYFNNKVILSQQHDSSLIPLHVLISFFCRDIKLVNAHYHPQHYIWWWKIKYSGVSNRSTSAKCVTEKEWGRKRKLNEWVMAGGARGRPKQRSEGGQMEGKMETAWLENGSVTKRHSLELRLGFHLSWMKYSNIRWREEAYY